MPRTKRRKKLSFVVTMKQPDGALVEDCRTYIYDSVSTWAGSLRPPGAYEENDPGDPLFSLDRESIKVRRTKL